MFDALITVRTDTPSENVPVTRVLAAQGIEAATRADAIRLARAAKLPKHITSQGYYFYSVGVQVSK